MAAVSLAMLSGIDGKILRYRPRQLAAGLYNGNPFVEAEDAGKNITRLCGPDGTVHIVGSEPEILWYARRKGTTRFDIAYPMTLPTPYAAGYQREAVAAVERNRPDVVVFVRTWQGFWGPPEICAGYLRAMGEMAMDRGYQLEWSHLAGIGWVAKGAWRDREAAGASMGIWQKTTGVMN